MLQTQTKIALATTLGLSALALDYQRMLSSGRVPRAWKQAVLERIETMAAEVVAAWPGTEAADVARLLKGDIALGQGRFDEAAEAFIAVETPARRLEALAKAAAAHWQKSLRLRRAAAGETAPPEAQAEADRALELLEEAYQTRLDAGLPETNPGRLENVADLAEIHLVEGRTSKALELLDPHVEALGEGTRDSTTRPLYVRLLKLRLRAHILAGQTEQAILDMRRLQAAGTGEPLTQLFFGLGRLLEQEMERHREAGDRAALERSRNTFAQFLDALTASDAEQSFKSLQWAGEQMLTLDQPKRAIELFERVMEEFPDHPRLVRTRLKLSAADRKAQRFEDAWSITSNLIEENPKALDALMERCQILEDWAKIEPGYWNVAIRYWQDLAKQLQGASPRPPEYYDCWYHVALCQYRKGSPDAARRTLKSVQAISQTLGSPEIKRKYEQLLRRVGG